MKRFPAGVTITDIEHKSLLHLVSDPEQWLRDAIAEKARLRREALFNQWRPRLFADPAVAEIPADASELVVFIMSRPDYKSRAQAEPEPPSRGNVKRFDAITRTGETVTLFPDGIDVPDVDTLCILAYVEDLDDWILGALLGQINRGKKKMIRGYYPILLADPIVLTIPADEEGLIRLITERVGYSPLWMQPDAAD